MARYSPLIDASVDLEFPPLLPHVNAAAAACLERTHNLPGVHIMSSNDTLSSVYQDFFYQNPSNHLDGGINEDGKWQDRWEKDVYFPNQCYEVPSGWVGKTFVSTLIAELDVIQHRK